VFLARRGIAVRYLGPNLPLEDLSKAVAQHHPAVVALSAQCDDTARNLRGASRILTGGTPPQPHLVLGGQAFNDDPALRALVDGTYVGPNATAASGYIAHLLEASAATRGSGQPSQGHSRRSQHR
jgi:methanogenic corrinoid protein MtbC1